MKIHIPIILIALTSCATTDIIKAVNPLSNTPSITANVGDNRKAIDVSKQKAITIDEIDSENVTLNNNVKQNETIKQTSLDNASADNIIQNNSIPWYAWLVVGLFIDFRSLIDNIKHIFTIKRN